MSIYMCHFNKKINKLISVEGCYYFNKATWFNVEFLLSFILFYQHGFASISHLQRRCVCAHLCQPLCDPMDSSPLGSSVLGILQTILEWIAISPSRRSSWQRNQNCISCTSCIGRQIFFIPSAKKIANLNVRQLLFSICDYAFVIGSLYLVEKYK